MSLLLLLPGAQVAGGGNTFTGTWVQPVYVGGFDPDIFDPAIFGQGAGWGAVVTVAPAVATRHFGGKRVRDAAVVTGPAGDRQQFRTFAATFAQAPAGWVALADMNDDELAIAFLLLAHD